MALTLLNNNTRAKDATVAVKYNTGTLTGSANTVTVYLRYLDANNNLSAVLTTTNGATTITLNERIAGTVAQVGSASGSALAASTNYFFYTKLDGANISATVYAVSGSVSLGSSVLSAGPAPVQQQQRGQVGWDSALVATGSSIGYTRLVNATYATFESTPFFAITPLRGALLSANISAANDLIAGHTLSATGDAFLIDQPIAGKDAKRVVRAGTSSSGGAQASTTIEIGSSTETIVEGEIYPLNQTQGTYQFKLIDGSSNVVFSAALPSLIQNQWNSFSIPILTELIPPSLSLIVEQTGTFADEFFLTNLVLFHNTISWSASVDNGSTWQKFIRINDPRFGLKFAQQGTQLKVRATAYSDHAWLQGYSIIPLYGFPGQLVYLTRFRTQDILITGKTTGNSSSSGHDARVIGQIVSTATADLRIGGGTGTNTTRDARVTGKAATITSQDIRLKA